jgi:hypothetical protein
VGSVRTLIRLTHCAPYRRGQTDLNGDGSLEVVALTHDYTLQLLKPQPPGRAGEGFAPAAVVAQVSLLPAKISIGLDRRPVGFELLLVGPGRWLRGLGEARSSCRQAAAQPIRHPPIQPTRQVALAAGYIDPEPREKVVAPRKQVLVVVTAAWHVLAFDHNLNLLWEGDVEGASSKSHARLHEVAVAITPHRVRGSDRGLIVVGGDVEVGELAQEAEGAHEAPAAGAGRVGGVLEGVLQDELKWEAEQGEHARSAPKQGGSSGGSLESAAAGTEVGAGADTSRHFDYYAFEGGSGESRWSHRAGAFHGGELEAASEELTPQHSFKLDAEKLAGRHYGELSCREFRESLLHALPHLWTRPEDTRLEEAAFVRHREGAGAQKGQLARTAAARAANAGECVSGRLNKWPFVTTLSLSAPLMLKTFQIKTPPCHQLPRPRRRVPPLPPQEEPAALAGRRPREPHLQPQRPAPARRRGAPPAHRRQRQRQRARDAPAAGPRGGAPLHG